MRDGPGWYSPPPNSMAMLFPIFMHKKTSVFFGQEIYFSSVFSVPSVVKM